MSRLTLWLSLVAVFVFVAPSYGELIAYEGFDYEEIGSDLLGKDGGQGFTGEWMRVPNQWGGEATTTYDIAEGSLSFGGISTTGNRVQTDRTNWALLGRALADPVSADETHTLYWSFLVRPEQRSPSSAWFGTALIGDVRQRIYSTESNSVYAGALTAGYAIENTGGSLSHPSGIPWNESDTALLVVKAELMPGIDTFTLYVNPIPGLAEPVAGTVKQDMDIGDVLAVALASNGAYSVDELRWGETFDDVVPAPPLSKVEFVSSGETWSVFPGTSEPSPFPELAWTTPLFDDTQWAKQQEGFGYGPGVESRGVSTVLDDMQDNYGTIYLRHEFEVDDPAAVSDLVLQMDYQDGFVAYVNGVEVARSNARTPGAPQPFDARGFSRAGDGVANFLIGLETSPELLRPGDDNVLAIQGINRRSSDRDFLLSQIQLFGLTPATAPALQAGDADMDLDFDQLDLVRVQVAAKYLSGEVATWGEGDWNGAPGGSPGNPPQGDGVFNQLDIVAAQQAGLYLSGRYAGIQANGLAPVPEPDALLLLGVGLIALALRRYRVGNVEKTG